MKPLLFAAAAVLLLPAAAQAQVAAATVPNTFDGPARPQAVAPAPTPAPEAEVSSTPANAGSEDTVRGIIAGAQTGTIDYSQMTDELAGKVREQEATVIPLIQGFGQVVSVDFVGSQNGIDVFTVTFANAATQWLIGHNEAGKVSALLFRPAEE
jgi:streptogramin lyase